MSQLLYIDFENALVLILKFGFRLSRGGSRIPCRRGHQPSMGRHQHTNFSKNCMKLRKCLSVGPSVRRGEGGMPGRPLGSATVILLSFQKLIYLFNFIIANTDRSLLPEPVRQLYKLRNSYMYFSNTIQINICPLTMTNYFLFYTIVLSFPW